MRECWLRPNRRVLAAAFVLPSVFIAVGTGAAVRTFSLPPSGVVLTVRFAGGAAATLGAIAAAWIVARMFRPRLAYRNGDLCVYLRTFAPIRLPIEHVECFFYGRAPNRTGLGGQGEIPAATVVVRIAEAAVDWRRRDVNRRLGNWCDGYIIIHGAWCEPISEDVLKGLNARLVQARREHAGLPQTSSLLTNNG